MARFFDPQSPEGNARLHAPATARNRDAILAVLKRHLPASGTVLEIASGTGEHAAHFAPAFPSLYWQPTDLEPRHIASIDAWAAHGAVPNLLPARQLDVLAPWPTDDLPAPIHVVVSANLIHIAPWAVAEALVATAGGLLPHDGRMVLYGPYKRGGMHTAPSNENFDDMLKAHDPAWGVRDLEAVTALATGAGFHAPEVIAMPANNFTLVFRKG